MKKQPTRDETANLPTNHPLWELFVEACKRNRVHEQITQNPNAFWSHGRLLWLMFIDGGSAAIDVREGHQKIIKR